jgi:hypothetical protein
LTSILDTRKPNTFNNLVVKLIQAAIRRGELLEVFFGFTLPRIAELQNVNSQMISNIINEASIGNEDVRSILMAFKNYLRDDDGIYVN